MGKQYELLKDLPDVNAGTAIKFNKTTDNYSCKNTKNGKAFFNKELIEDNPMWFKEVPETADIDWLGIIDNIQRIFLGDRNAAAKYLREKMCKCFHCEYF